MDRVVWPQQVRAQGRARPRGSARNCIFIEMGGAISQMECWDFKETRFTPTDLEPQRINDDIVLSKTLFPNLGNYMDRVSFVRSMRANELVSFHRAVPHPDWACPERRAREGDTRLRLGNRV